MTVRMPELAPLWVPLRVWAKAVVAKASTIAKAIAEIPKCIFNVKLRVDHGGQQHPLWGVPTL